MPPPPPLKDVLEALQQGVLPGAGAAAVVMCAFLVVGRWRAAALGSAAAVVVAFACGNFTLANLKTADPLPTWENTSRLVPWKPAETDPCERWLPRAALVLVGMGLVTRWFGMLLRLVTPTRVWWAANLVVWWLRGWTVYLVSGWLVLGSAATTDPKWEHLRWELAVAMLLVWLVLDHLARSGASGEISAYLAAAFFAGAAVLLYSHNGRFMELAVVLGSAMFGISAAVCVLPHRDDAKALASGAIPAAVAFLPGLLLGTRPSHDPTKVPVESFWLVALAPLVLAPFMIPRLSRQNRWLLFVLRALLILTPLVLAVVLAGQHEKFPYEEPEW